MVREVTVAQGGTSADRNRRHRSRGIEEVAQEAAGVPATATAEGAGLLDGSGIALEAVGTNSAAD